MIAAQFVQWQGALSSHHRNLLVYVTVRSDMDINTRTLDFPAEHCPEHTSSCCLPLLNGPVLIPFSVSCQNHLYGVKSEVAQHEHLSFLSSLHIIRTNQSFSKGTKHSISHQHPVSSTFPPYISHLGVSLNFLWSCISPIATPPLTVLL